MKCWRVACAQVAKKPNRKSSCVNRPADALGIWHPTTDEPATLAPGPHGRGGFDRNGHGVCRVMVAVTMRMTSRRWPISLIRRSIINWTSASVMEFSVLAVMAEKKLFSERYFLDGRSRAGGRRVCRRSSLGRAAPPLKTGCRVRHAQTSNTIVQATSAQTTSRPNIARGPRSIEGSFANRVNDASPD
jgi:hypothetical protein